MNTLFVQRLLQGIQRPTPGLLPLNTGPTDYSDIPHGTPRQSRGSKGGSKSDRGGGGSSRDRGRGGSEYERSRGGARVEKGRGRQRSPSTSSDDTGEYGSPSSSDYESYDDPEVIKQRYKKEPCEYVSPGVLGAKKTKKEVVNYLEEKKCPKIETHAKKRKHVSATSSAPATAVSSTPAPTTTAPPPGPVDNLPPPPASSTPAPSAVKDEGLKKKPVGRPKKPADPNPKPKKPASAYATAVGKYRKQGLPFKEAVAKAKEELASK